MRTWHQLLMTFLAAKTLKRQRCIVTSFLLINPHINAKSGCQPVCFLISLAFHTHTRMQQCNCSASLCVCVCVCANSLICRQWEKQRHKSPRYNERALFHVALLLSLRNFAFVFPLLLCTFHQDAATENELHIARVMARLLLLLHMP